LGGRDAGRGLNRRKEKRGRHGFVDGRMEQTWGEGGGGREGAPPPRIPRRPKLLKKKKFRG